MSSERSKALTYKYTDWNDIDVQYIFAKLFDVEIEFDKINTEWIVAYQNGAAIALAGLSKCSKTVGHLELAGVLSCAQGQGIQKRLIRLRERLARKRGYTKLITYTAHWNVASSNSLMSCGYKMYRPLYAWGGKEFVYWWKNI